MKTIAFCLTILLVSQVEALFSVISFAKQLYIPGQYFSLMNFSKNTQPFQNYYDISINYSLEQTAYSDQGNSIYDTFLFQRSAYSTTEPNYYKTITYLNNLYDQFQPCQGGYSFQSEENFGCNSTDIDLSTSEYNNISLIVDNTFYPCNGGAYQSEIYLYQIINLTIQSNTQYLFIMKIIFVLLLQIFIFLFAFIVITLQKLQTKKKKLKKIKQQEEDLQVLYSLQMDRENN